MRKKIKITERQLNMIVESIIKNENINEEQLDEGLKELVTGGLMALATLFGGKSIAQTNGFIAPMEKDVKVINLVGYNKEDVNIIYSDNSSRIIYTVYNNISGGNIGQQTEKTLEDMLGIVVKDDSKVNDELTIVAGDVEGEGAFFYKLKNKLNQDIYSHQTIDLVIGKKALSDGKVKINYQ